MTPSYTACTSQDGTNWVRGGVWTHSLGADAPTRRRADAQIGLVSLAAPDADRFTAEFDHVRVYSLQGGPRGA